jgi:class 3 adenylate cyclase
MKEYCKHEVSPPGMSTALLVDLRNFTPNLNAAKSDEHGINVFCHFLSEFYALCLDASLTALPSDLRQQPPLYMSSTGDGVLIIFTHDAHARHGFLTAVMLHIVLRIKCEEYNSRLEPYACPQTSFGIGVESGPVFRILAQSAGDNPSPIVDTYIGPCINIAARAEAMTKLFHGANTIIAKTTNELLCKELLGTNYAAFVQKAYAPDTQDDERLTTYDEMNLFNRTLCLFFIQHHNLKGVDHPVALFRIADSSAQIGNPRFEALLGKLTDSSEHLADVYDFLARSAGAQ